ncbi:hypothetical protein LTS08_001156 [Lithohypha guttulata]|uniref:Non-structural maintenance of chromosomes element 1 homolog n=1 Tax=Lithohypha guttulata TaxID=1690604 RepID=A0AAN7SU52_9EURO|nr:hypothetical protein LTR51_007841 [Lithohypha guttulata]KAK5081580.1 hypothetical protein LTR05_007711 [Lithohypha guttulata]KAK5104885.1 hypothetical protein LTS08_001156 [Lithohypha guttulata]
MTFRDVAFDMEYEDTNRAFIQAFFARNVLTFEEARPLLAHIFSVHEKREISIADITVEDFNSMIAAANDALSPLDYVIRSTRGQEDNERYYALVNTTSDQLTQIATIHSSDEIGYVKRLLDEIFDANNTERREAMCIAGKDALNLTRAGRRETQTQNGENQATKFNLTAHEAEVLLAKLVAEGWLNKSQKGFYSLSPRGLMELKIWLEETYNDEENEYKKIKTCEACKEVITVLPWDGQHYVGEKAITTSESYLRGKRRSGVRPASDDIQADEDTEE